MEWVVGDERKNRRAARRAAALFSATTLLAIAGCASIGAQDPQGRDAPNPFDSFKRGEIRLTGTFCCTRTWNLARERLRAHYDHGAWESLALETSQIGLRLDLAYFYLGRAAEGLGYVDAARSYFSLARDATMKCNSALANICDGINLPTDAQARADALTTRPAIASAMEASTPGPTAPADASEVPRNPEAHAERSGGDTMTVAPAVQTWVDITTGDATLQIDQGAISQVGEGQVTAVWRIGSKAGGPMFVKRATVDCREQSLRLSTSTLVDAERGLHVVRDYAAGKQRYGDGRDVSMSDSERVEGNAFPAATSPEGLLLRQVCQEHYVSKVQREASARALQVRIGCGTAGPYVGTPLCAKDSVTLDSLHSFLFRMDQVTRACGMSSEKMGWLMNSWFSQLAEQCRAGLRCDMSPVEADTQGMGGDLARVANKQSCSHIPSSIRFAAEREEFRDAIHRLLACVKRTIPSLDDLVSPANVVADAVFESCRGETSRDVAERKASFLSDVAAAVLQFRRLARIPPPKPGRPKSKLPET